MAKDILDTQKTKQFKQIYEYIKENIKEIVLLINVVGFVVHFYYYKGYGIPIFNYVGLNDLIFLVLEYVLAVALIVFFFEYLIFVLYLLIRPVIKKYIISRKESLKQLYNDDKEAKKKINKVFYNSILVGLKRINQYILLPLSIAAFFLPFKQYTMPLLIFGIVYLFVIPVMKGEVSKYAFVIGILLVPFMLYSLANDSHYKTMIKQDYTISFVENGQLITTEKGESTLNYLGESSVAIFLYDIERKEARIFNKSNISDIKIQSISIYDLIVSYIKDKRNYQLFLVEEEQ